MNPGGEETERLQEDQRSKELTDEFREIVLTTPPELLPQKLTERELALKRKNARLRELVNVDTLVHSVFSHGHFLELLEKEIEATQKMNDPSSILITLDLDHFRETNEVLGHPSTDRLLVAVGQAIADSIRPGDSPGRTGGDEFSVILRRTHPVRAILVAERIRKVVMNRISTEFFREGFYQSLSIGLCAIPKGSSVEQVRTIADAALYTVKNNGRNQIAVGSINPNTGSIETFIVPSEPTPIHP